MADIDIKESNWHTASRQIHTLMKDMIEQQGIPISAVLVAFGAELSHALRLNPYTEELVALGKKFYLVGLQRQLPTLGDVIGSIFSDQEPPKRKEELN